MYTATLNSGIYVALINPTFFKASLRVLHKIKTTAAEDPEDNLQTVYL